LDSLIWVVAFVFVTSFLSNISPFVGASYTLLAALQLNLLGVTPYNFLVIVLVSALGASVAKVFIYLGALGFKDLLIKNKNVRLIGRSSSRSSFYLVLYVTSLLPIFPLDDFIYIGAGATSASLRLMTIVSFAAKVLKSGAEIALEVTILRDLSGILDLHRLDLTLALTLVFIGIGILVYKIDWEATYRRLMRRPKPQTGTTPVNGG
jgi:hypothetical protein